MPPRPPTGPVATPPPGLRQRLRADGSWRIWWEPTARQRKAGAQPAELRADNAGWSVAEAKRLTKKADAAARGEAKAPRGNSVSACIQDYLASRHFLDLRATTQESYRANLRPIEAKWGAEPIASFDAPVLDLWYDQLLQAKGTFRALAIVGMFGIVFTHAERRGWRPKGSNPVRDLGMKKPKGRSRVGTWAELEACLQAARDQGRLMLRLALLLAIFSGQRQTDILQARPQDFISLRMLVPGQTEPRAVWIWSLVRSKRGNAGAVPMHAEIVPALRLARQLAAKGPGTLIWDEVTGNTYDRFLIAARWQKIRAKAAETVPSVATLQWRDLRRTFAQLARQGGASVDDVGDAIGNTAATNPELRQVYMAAQIETTARAVRAIERPKGPERKQG